MFYKQIILNKGLPFEVKLSMAKPVNAAEMTAAVYGNVKGKYGNSVKAYEMQSVRLFCAQAGFRRVSEMSAFMLERTACVRFL